MEGDENNPINAGVFTPITTYLFDRLTKEKNHYHEKSNALEKELNWLKEQVQLLRHHRFGKSTEQLDQILQTQLFDERWLEDVVSPEASQEDIHYTRRKPKANRLPYMDTSLLPREQQRHDLSESEKVCGCGQELKSVGEDIREEVQCIPAQFKVIEHIRPKYSCPVCQCMKAAPALALPIRKSKASSSLLSEIIVNKYLYHLPLYRQAKLFEVNGLKISDRTLGYLVMKSAELLEPLSDALWSQLATIKRLQLDETKVKVLKPDKQGWMWIYHSYSQENRFVIFEFDMTRSQRVVNNRLIPFKGLLQSDGYSGYHGQRAREDIINIGCWDHCRRYFVDVVKASGKNKQGKAGSVLTLISKLYDIEHRIKSCSYEERYRIRQKESKPKLDHLLSYLKKINAPPQSLLHKAVRYALNQWEQLTAYVDHGDAQFSNCWAENLIRPFAVGRRNWLFIGNEASGQKAALLHSLILTCVMNKIEPRQYLQYVLNQVHCLRRKEINPVSLLPQFIDPMLWEKNRNR